MEFKIGVYANCSEWNNEVEPDEPSQDLWISEWIKKANKIKDEVEQSLPRNDWD